MPFLPYRLPNPFCDNRAAIDADFRHFRQEFLYRGFDSSFDILRADLSETLINIHKSLIIFTKSLILIACESNLSLTSSQNIPIIKVFHIAGSLELLQPYISHYLSLQNKKSPKHVYYFHADKWHLVPINRFLKHSSSPQA